MKQPLDSKGSRTPLPADPGLAPSLQPQTPRCPWTLDSGFLPPSHLRGDSFPLGALSLPVLQPAAILLSVPGLILESSLLLKCVLVYISHLSQSLSPGFLFSLPLSELTEFSIAGPSQPMELTHASQCSQPMYDMGHWGTGLSLPGFSSWKS